MMSRRILSPSSLASSTSSANHLLFNASAASLRPVSRSFASRRAPTLADIAPENASTFDTRQKEFRERIKTEAEEKKRKEQEESKLKRSHSSSSSASAAGATTSVFGSLSSLTSSLAEEARAREESAQGKKAGPLSSLIYGTHEGRELDRELERSFSQVLARGKYVHSIVFHEVKPDKVDEYVKLVGDWYSRVPGMPEMNVNLVGSWRTEVGDCDTFGTSFLLRLAH
jgi:hypothetical protein